MLIRGIWALQLDPGEDYKFRVQATFKITMAVIDKFSKDKRTSVFLSFQNKSFMLCSLIPGKIEQQVLNIICTKGELIKFTVEGPNAINLLGNYVSQQDEDEEEEAENHTEMPYLECKQDEHRKSAFDGTEDSEESISFYEPEEDIEYETSEPDDDILVEKIVNSKKSSRNVAKPSVNNSTTPPGPVDTDNKKKSDAEFSSFTRMLKDTSEFNNTNSRRKSSRIQNIMQSSQESETASEPKNTRSNNETKRRASPRLTKKAVVIPQVKEKIPTQDSEVLTQQNDDMENQKSEKTTSQNNARRTSPRNTKRVDYGRLT